MKRIFLAVIAAGASLALSVTACAQAAGPTGGATTSTLIQPGLRARGGPVAAYKAVLEQLNLTDDQKASIKALDEKTLAALKDVRKEFKANPDKTAMREKLRPIMKGFHESLMAILTPAQQTQFKELWKAQREKEKAAKAAAGTAPKPLR